MAAVDRSKLLYLSSNGLYKQPNLRFFSLNEDSNEWTTWKSSDYFYPEMIPEPDYSDSGEDAGSEEDDEGYGPYRPETTSAIERLRELTEVYVSKVDLKKAPTQPKKAASKQAGTTSKAGQKPTKVTSKSESGKTVKAAGKAPQRKKSPSPTRKTTAKAGTKSPSPTRKTTAKAGTKSPSEISKAPAKTPLSTTSGRDKSPKTSPKSPPRTKTTPSAAKKASPAVSKTKAKTPPPVPAKGVAAKKKASPTAALNVKVTSKEPAAPKKATPKGTSAVSRKSPPSSPSSTKSKSPVSSEQSSDDEQLIKPRKAVPPHLQSTERQKLHKELKFSQKYGKLGASSKTELQLALERYTENKVKREVNAEDKTSLEKILEFQAKKIEMQEIMDKAPAWVERLQKPPTVTDPKTDEFYRVHARVVSSNALTHCFLSDDDRSECSSPGKLLNSDSGSDS